MSLLNTDQTPASFWITHSDNQFIGNHAAGSARYGFWFDLQKHATGASRSRRVCPIGAVLGRFEGNVAHSNGRYGLRIFHEHYPKRYQCSGQSSWNQAIVAEYKDYTGYRNGRAAIIGEKLGALVFTNIKTADNG